MGGSVYSSVVYSSRLADVKAKGSDFFEYSAAISSGTLAAAVHEDLNPAKKNKAGQIIRESRDSDTHPNSRAVAFFWDDTGSMKKCPRLFVDNLGTLMGSLVKKGILPSPHILFGAVGDATCDKVPLQIGQFEAGNEMDDVLSKIFLEGGGGAGTRESYELALYFMARHTSIDCWEKRGEKGILFLAGDELPYTKVSKTQVKNLIGADIQEDIPLEDILAELKNKWEVFWIYPKEGSYFEYSNIVDQLKALFGQNFLVLDKAEDIAVLIAKTIALLEGFDETSVDAGLKDLGVDDKSLRSTSTALSTFKASTSVMAGGKIEGLVVKNDGHDDLIRL